MATSSTLRYAGSTSATASPVASFPAEEESPISMVRGRHAVASYKRLLVQLCDATGQSGAMDTLEHLLHSPTALEKTPCLVLVGFPGALSTRLSAAEATLSDLRGAVLLYEYRVLGRPTGIFATDDVTGHRTVIAFPESRVEVAEQACRTLLRRGALMLLVSLDGAPVVGKGAASPGTRQAAADEPLCSRAVRVRNIPRDLKLETTLEATLAQMGSNTRRNLRRYRKRLETNLGAHFVPEAEVGLDEFLELARNATNPIPVTEAAWRYNALQASPGRMLLGVKAQDGRWLSLIGGQRNGTTTELEWQVNRGDLPHYSLSTVMRAYLLENEIALGMSRVMFKGGTPHSMRHSLIESRVTDLIVVRRTPLAMGLRKAARWVFPHSIYLGHALRDPDLIWTSW